jgi:2-C-methyl-D-erythritol 4-phosphate cytidylyltransferase
VTVSAQPEVSAIVPLAMPDAEDVAFVTVAGEALVSRVVRALLDVVSGSGRIVVAVAEPLADAVRRILADGNLLSAHVVAAAGSGTRGDCLAAALECVHGQGTTPHAVLVYDLRQPLPVRDVCDRVIAALCAGSPVVFPVLPVTDSVKAVDGHGRVTRTLDRSTLQIVQYPRGFAADRLDELLARRASENFDEIAEAIAAAAPVTTVQGDAAGFIAELPRDAEFVEAVIASRWPDPRVS